MITSTALNRITDFLPALDFGKLWSLFKVSKPTRPLSAKERAKRFHHVTWDGKMPVFPDDILGCVYITPDNKAVYWNNLGDETAQNATYIRKSPKEVFLGGQDGCVSVENIKDKGGAIDLDDRKQLLKDYHGDQEGIALLTKTLG